MQRLLQIKGTHDGLEPRGSIPLQTNDYRAVRQKDVDLEDDGDADGDEPRLEGHPHDATSATPRLSTLASIAVTPWIVHALLLLINLFTFAYLLQRTPSDAACTKQLSSWSPAINAGTVHYKTIPINGSASQENQYKGKPDAEIDAAWAKITTSVPKLQLSAHDLGMLQKSAEGVYEADSGFVGQLQVYELLTCLDNLRQASYRGQYPDLREGTDGFDEEAWHQDLDHCTDMLRVELMCKSDVDVLTYSAGAGHRADFSAVKKCRDFDEILGWSYGLADG